MFVSLVFWSRRLSLVLCACALAGDPHTIALNPKTYAKE